MRRKLTFYCTIVLVVLLSEARGQECTALRVGVVDDWLPISYINQDTQELVGVATDLTKVIGNRLHIPIIINTDFPWKRTLYYLKTGRLDLTTAIYWKQEREDFLHFTVPYITNEARVFVLKEKTFPIDQLEDLKGYTGVITLGASFGDNFDTFAKTHKLHLVTVGGYKQKIQMLLTGRADYFIQDYLDGMMYLNQQGLQHKFVALPYPISTTNVHLAVSLQSPCIHLAPKINSIISELKEDGTFKMIIDKYIKGSP